MKQHAWLLFGLVLTLCQCLAAAQAAAAAPALEMRKVQRGTLGHACRSSFVSKQHRCNSGLFCNTEKKKCAALGSVGSPCKKTKNCSGHASGSICFAGKCLANVNRPKLAPCSADAMCATGYCGTRSRCASQHKQNESCVRAAQCETLNCDGATQKCGAGLSTPPSANAAASAALASVTLVANSKAFYDSSLSRPLLVRSGQVKTAGSVKVVNTPAGPAIEMAATSAQPAMLQQVLDSTIQRRDTATNAVLSFGYLVTSTSGTCSIVPSINGQQLTPFIAITAAQQSGKGSYTYSGAPVTSYAVGVVCDGQGASSTVDFDNVAVTSSAAAATATTTTTTATGTAAGPSSSASSPSSTYPPLPTGACSGLANCDMEAGTPFVLTDSSDCRVETNQAERGHYPSHSGSSAIVCFANPGFETFLTSTPNAHTYTAGSAYTLTFWARNASTPNAFSSLRCTVRGGNDGQGALAYDGVCPLTSTPADSNGYNLFAVPFTATDANMQFMMHFVGPQRNDDYDYQSFNYDDVSILDGQYSVGYTTPPAIGTASSDVAVTTCSGGVLRNCGFETGYSNAWARNIADANSGSGTTTCNVTSDADSVHSGKYAFQCFIDPAARTPIYGEGLSQNIDIRALTPGTVYDFSFWAKTSAASSAIMCTIGSPVANYLGQTMAVDTSSAASNGFSKYSAKFATDYAETQTLTLTCLGMQPGATYTFDDFDVQRTTAMLDPNAIPTHCSGLAGCSLDYPTTAQQSDPTYLASLIQWVVQNNRADYDASVLESFCDQWFDGNPYLDADNNNLRYYARSGRQMKLCNIPSASSINRYFYIQGGQNHTYVQGQQYTWSFWVRVAQPSSLKCVIWDNAGDGNRVYDGVCPITTAEQVNGYSQVALTFTADSTDMSFFVAATDVGTYVFDEFSMLDGTFPITYTTQPSALPSTSSAQQQCNGLHNCGWETGYMNGWKLRQTSYTDCAITSNAANVRAGGQYALACTSKKPAAFSSVGFYMDSPTYSLPQFVQGASYTYSFWAKGLGSNAVVSSSTSNFSPVGSPDANGFQKYAVTFIASSTSDASYTTIRFALSDATTNFFLDDFALVQQKQQQIT